MKKNKFGKVLRVTTASILSTVLVISGATSPQIVEAKNTKPWVTAYKKVINKLEKQYAKEDTKLTYDLIYFNKDKTPELVVGQTGYWVSMYTFEKGKTYKVIDQWGYGAMGNAGYFYIPKKNVLVNWNTDFAGARCYTYYGKMKNHKIVSYYAKELRQDFFSDKNKNGMPDDGEYVEKGICYYGDKKISQKKFNSYLIEGDIEDIVGSMTKKEIFKLLAK